MVRMAFTFFAVIFVVGAGACEGDPAAPAAPVASDETAVGDFEAALTTEGVTSATLARLDRLTSATKLRVPRKSLKALADGRYVPARRKMVDFDIGAKAADMRDPVRDPRVLQAMRLVPRHEFVPASRRVYSYIDSPLPIGQGQTISQPYIVAFMTELLKPQPGDRILEIGTGSGYQAAVLGLLVKEVYTIEIVEALGKRAEKDLARLGYDNVHVRIGDGYRGWPEKAPFDGVIVTAAPEVIPRPLIDQLKVGGRLVIPVGPVAGYQELKVVRKTPKGQTEERIFGVRFVPMVGEVEKEKRR